MKFLITPQTYFNPELFVADESENSVFVCNNLQIQGYN